MTTHGNLLQLSTYVPPEAVEAKAPEAPAVPPPPSTDESLDKDTEYRLHRRFDRLGRLFGDGAVSHLMSRRVVIFGVGGVGSFAAEAIARSAIGRLMLVDFDEVCTTNTNRQLQALSGTVGRPKAELLAERMRQINPQAKVESRHTFYNAARSDELLSPPWAGDTAEWDFVVDCVDNLTAKAHLIATCKERGIPVVSSMGAAGKLDPTRIRVADLADTQVCRLARDLRKILRKKHGFPDKGPMGVKVIYSDEHRNWPRELSYDGGEGFKCVCPNKNPEHGCDSRALIDGTVSYVTGAFGLACASVVINTLTEQFMGEARPLAARSGTMPEEEAARLEETP